ncbi:acyltransferase [Halovulum dunhuangense]|uniref:Acyltransferase n=1 Tax=Halovulum dunhuangense TaxID=1505036 RepID=A0A849L480_9RHOB|nr:acyltransferase [Halovulum dunhuangense]NNU81002.1 acyltransferase [Halovulum dunhuangense]
MSGNSAFLDYIENLPLRVLHHATRRMPLAWRGAVAAWVGRRVILNVPGLRRRVESNLAHVYPDMPAARRDAILRANAGNIGRTMFEMRDNARLVTDLDRIEVVPGEGLDALEAARAAGRGALLVSGHFGQWDAVRAALKARGMECGGIYRDHDNRYFNADMLPQFESGGRPLFAKTPKGMRDLIKHVRAGGFAAVMMDQKTRDGEILDFMGKPATTATGIAELALRYDLPLVPAYGIRKPDGISFRIEFEPPIPHTDALTMSQAVNDSLAARVHAMPEQWHWLHRRWDLTTRASLRAQRAAAG